MDSRKTSSNCSGLRSAGALQIFDRGLQWEERVFQLVRQAAGEFAPGGHALGLHQALALFAQLRGHMVEGAANWPISFRPVTGTRVFQSPAEIWRAPSTSLNTGRVTPAAPHQLRKIRGRRRRPQRRVPADGCAARG